MTDLATSKPEIAIFVSHRIDLNSYCVDQPIYHHMLCGSIYTHKKKNNMLRDDVGDNISEKRISFCELTVQYWAWKNYQADYYGLCHYRRYISFSNEPFPKNDYNLILEDELSEKNCLIHGLTENNIRPLVESNDIIVGQSFDTTLIKRIKPKKSVLDLWLASRELVEPKSIYTTIELIRELYPQYYASAQEYLNSNYYYGYNCYIMKKELFFNLCQFQFDIMFALESKIDMSNYTGNMLRTPGYMSELLFGVYIYHLKKLGKYKIQERPIVFFQKTRVENKKNKYINPQNYNPTKKKSIKIFVSQRIDKNCNLINGKNYYHMRCGAIFDKRKIQISGDNSKDNISEKRSSYCELTVQYWMWKNYYSDFYGLCHYRRYFSFSDTYFPQCSRGYILEKFINRNTIKKYNINNTKKIDKIVSTYDAIFPLAIPVSTMDFLYKNQKAEKVMDVFLAQIHLYENKAVYITLDIVKEKYPNYYDAALTYLNGDKYYGYNCFILCRTLFYKMCQFEFDVLSELEVRLDMSKYTGNMIRTPGYMSELLFGIFITWLYSQGNFRIKELQLVFFNNPEKKESSIFHKIPFWKFMKQNSKKIARSIFPSYRVSLRIEDELLDIKNMLNKQGCLNSHSSSMLINLNFKAACFANELYDIHKASFSEFKGVNTGKTVVIVATGPTMKYYSQIENAIHIGVNAAFKNPNLKLDYYFTSDYENRNEWFQELKNYDFIKFFGRYPHGTYQEKFQIPENIFQENHARAFFQSAPSTEFHMNIECYPLMGYYSIVFQAIHFALYTNAKEIILVGCDCSSDGYFDGSSQKGDVLQKGGIPMWKKGYNNLKLILERYYPHIRITSLNPIGLRGLFHDVYSHNFLIDHLEINSLECETLDQFLSEGIEL